MAKNNGGFTPTPRLHFAEEKQFGRKFRNLSHFVVERDLLVRWGLIGGEDATDDIGAGSGAAHVGKLVVAERFDDVVEVGSGGEGEASEKDSTRLKEQ